MGARQPKGLNRIANVGEGHIYLREEYLSFNNNHMIYELYISIKNMYKIVSLVSNLIKPLTLICSPNHTSC